MAGTSVTVVGGVVLCASLLYLIRLLWRKNKRTSVKNKVVFITGASSGLGEACAHVFYRAGAKVILAARRVPELERVANDLKKINGVNNAHEPKIVSLNLEDLGSIPMVAKAALDFYGHVDILINNGGISYRGQATETALEVDVKVMTINYFGHVALTKALLPSMIARQQGHIVGISSVQGKLAIPYRSPYSASKHAFQAFFDTLRAEVAHRSIHVSVISPGYIQTNLSVNAVTENGSTYGVMDTTTQSGMKPAEVARRVLESVIYCENEVVLAPLVHRLVIAIRTFCPSLFFSLMFSRARKQREGIKQRN